MTNMESSLFNKYLFLFKKEGLLALLVFVVTFISVNSHAQQFNGFNPSKIKRIKDVTIIKSGGYLGLQRGKFTILELGAERQWKKIKLIKPITNAVHVGFNYNFKYNVLGYDAGYWFKIGRLNLTYGINACFRTDFTHNKVGIAPVLGFKFMQFHLQTGYHFLTNSAIPMHTNTYFISLRWVLINNRKVDVDKK